MHCDSPSLRHHSWRPDRLKGRQEVTRLVTWWHRYLVVPRIGRSRPT